jgi:hypothetical protein
MAARSSSLGILPASLSLLALTIIMNLTIILLTNLIAQSREFDAGPADPALCQ